MFADFIYDFIIDLIDLIIDSEIRALYFELNSLVWCSLLGRMWKWYHLAESWAGKETGQIIQQSWFTLQEGYGILFGKNRQFRPHGSKFYTSWNSFKTESNRLSKMCIPYRLSKSRADLPWISHGIVKLKLNRSPTTIKTWSANWNH